MDPVRFLSLPRETLTPPVQGCQYFVIGWNGSEYFISVKIIRKNSFGFFLIFESVNELALSNVPATFMEVKFMLCQVQIQLSKLKLI